MSNKMQSEGQGLSRAQFEFLLRRAGLSLPAAEYDSLFEGAAYIDALVARLGRPVADDNMSGSAGDVS